MARTKDEVISIRTTTEIKSLLAQAAESEHRSMASMLEALIFEYASRRGQVAKRQLQKLPPKTRRGQ